MYEVHIKVIKKEFYPDIAEKYLIAGEKAGACPVHETGDVFIYKGDNEKPDGLCATAWLSTRGIMKNLTVFVPLHGLTYAVRLLPSQTVLRIIHGTTGKGRQ